MARKRTKSEMQEKARRQPPGAPFTGRTAPERRAAGWPWNSRWAGPMAAGLILLAAVSVYSNTFGCPFILDDRISILRNPTICSLWPVWKALGPPSGSEGVTVSGRPLLNFSFALNYAVGGLAVQGYHLANLVIHILAGLLLMGILRRTLLLPALRDRWAPAATPLALAVALVWVVHPLQTESVTYIVQRAESLVSLFYLLTLYCVIRGAVSNRPFRWSAVACAACLLGMASKEVMVTAPLVVLLYDRTFLSGSFRGALRARYRLYLALAATWGVLVWMLFSTGFYSDTASITYKEFNRWSYLMTQSGVLVHYLRLAFWPTGFCLDYCWPPARTLGAIMPSGLLIAGLLGLTGWGLWKRSAVGFLGGCFFLILAPTSTILVLDAACEHRMYLPLAPVATAAVVGGCLVGQWLVRHRRLSPWTAQAAGVVLVMSAGVLLGGLTFRRNRDYRSEVSIWADVLRKAPKNPRAYGQLGNALARRARFGEAIVEFEKALELKPDDARTHNNLGNALSGLHRFGEAIVQYRKALELAPDYAKAHDNLGMALADCGRAEEAIAHFRAALELNSDFAGAHYHLANTLARQARFPEAILHYQKALEIEPGYLDAHNNLAAALNDCGRFDEAIFHGQAALRLQPGYTKAYHNLRTAQVRREQLRQLLEQRTQWLASHPNDGRVLHETAWMMATNPNASIRNGAEAVALAKRAVTRAGSRDPVALDTLAAAYAEAAQFPAAMQTAQQALELAVQQDKRALADSIRAEMRLYKGRMPLRKR